MNNPKFEEYMIPIINIMHDGIVREHKTIRAMLVNAMKLTEEQLQERGKSGTLKYRDNIGFALSYLSMASLLDKPGRGKYVISKQGMEIYNKHLNGINTEFLKSISPEFKERIEGHYKSSAEVSKSNHPNTDILNPHEQVEEGARLIKDSVGEDLLTNLRNSSPAFFEKVVVDLIKSMGYAYDENAGLVVGKSHDGGVDGIISEDKLGLSKIYLQAKRYGENNTVGRPEIQKFIGALYGKTTKGIFLTTSSFSKEAIEEVKSKAGMNIILIDGQTLVKYMYDYDIGVSTTNIIKIKAIDNDYFDELESN